jgi:hypothetical protein
MSNTRIAAVVAAVLIGSASAALAQYDGDGNRVPGAHQRGTLIERPAAPFDNVFAAPRPATRALRRELDGDGNRVLGSW